MPGRKKTNYIAYELKKLDKYIKELHAYLDANPPHLMVDRVEHATSTRGNPIIKLIASKEDQLKTFTATLEKLPKILEDVNRLRKAVDGEEEKDVRGGHNLPGFMQVVDEDDDDYKTVVNTRLNEEDDDFEEEDDEIIKKEPETSESEEEYEKKLPPSSSVLDEEDITSIDEEDDYFYDPDLDE